VLSLDSLLEGLEQFRAESSLHSARRTTAQRGATALTGAQLVVTISGLSFIGEAVDIRLRQRHAPRDANHLILVTHRSLLS